MMSHEQVVIAGKSVIFGVIAGAISQMAAIAEPIIAQVTTDPSGAHSLMDRGVAVAVVMFFLWWLVEQNRASRKDAKEAQALAHDEKQAAMKISAEEKQKAWELAKDEKEVALKIQQERENYMRGQIQMLQHELLAISRASTETVHRNLDVLGDSVRRSLPSLEVSAQFSEDNGDIIEG